MKDPIPIFNKEGVEYSRKEKEGFWTYTPRLHPETRELIINSTSKEILSICDGTRTLSDVEKEMKKRYPEVDNKTIKTDVDSILASFTRLGMLEWKGDNPFLYKRAEPVTRDISLMVAQENDILKLEKFINSWSNNSRTDYIFFKSPTNQPNSYNELSLRQKLFFYSEEFYLLVKNNKIIGLISIGLQLGYGPSVAGINLIICPKKYFTRLLHYSQDIAPVLSVIDFTKIRLFEPLEMPINPELKNKLKSEGYHEEGILKNEFGFGKDVRIWAYYYDKKLIDRCKETRKKLTNSMIDNN